MKNGKIFCYCPEKFLACIDADTGELLWKNSDEDLLESHRPQRKAQHYITGYATTCYMKCTDRHVFFAGPQREKTVVASATMVHCNGRMTSAICSSFCEMMPSMLRDRSRPVD